MKYSYGFTCTQANGSTYAPVMKGFNRLEAINRMNEAKKVFDSCKNFKLVKQPMYNK